MQNIHEYPASEGEKEKSWWTKEFAIPARLWIIEMEVKNLYHCLLAFGIYIYYISIYIYSDIFWSPAPVAIMGVLLFSSGLQYLACTLIGSDVGALHKWMHDSTLQCGKGERCKTCSHHATMISDTELGDISNTINTSTQESFKCFIQKFGT